MNFNSKIVKAEWHDRDGEWKVTIQQKQINGETKAFEDSCNVLLYATGVLNNIKRPDIEDLDVFKGKVKATEL